MATASKAAIAGNHGYRIDGDVAVLNAHLAASDCDATNVRWALQLWACEEPHAGGCVSGIKVAEVDVDLSCATPGTSQHVCAESPLQLPATGRDYAMVLVLASGASGSFEQVHDFANYADRQPFLAPRLDGAVGYVIEGGEVELHADGVFNPRPATNRSGSLALELRAVPIDAAGGGSPIVLATSPLGCLSGQCALSPAKQRAPFSPPPVGTWRLVLVLVEWTPWGFADRAARTFETPYRSTACEDKFEIAAPAAGKASVAVVSAVCPTDVASHAEGPPAATPPAERQRDGGQRGSRVSIQTASVEDLSQVKGLTRKLAQEIVKARPFRSVDELVRVRGIGEKTARKLRGLLTL